MKTRLLLLLLPLLATTLTFPVVGEEESRTWTNHEGKTITAALVSLSGDQVSLRLENGNVVPVPATTLSKVDQDYLRQWVDSKKAMADAKGTDDPEILPYSGPPPATEWPRTFSAEGDADPIVVKEDAEAKEFIYETEHYEFVCDSKFSTNLVKEFSRIFEATYELNCHLPLDLKPRPERLRKKFLARIFTSREDYMSNGGMAGSAGVYSSGKKALMLPLESLGVKMVGSRVSIDYSAQDYRTLIHEITHQMMTHWLGPLPTWYTEGSAEYVELAEYSRGKFSFLRHDDNLQGHLARWGGGEFPMVPVERLMTISPREWSEAVASDDTNYNYPSALILTYFFYHLDGDGDGTHMIAFLRGIEKLERPSDEDVNALIKEHLLRTRDYATLGDEVAKAMRKLGIKIAFPDS